MIPTDWVNGFLAGIAIPCLCLAAGAAWNLSMSERRPPDDDPYRAYADDRARNAERDA